MTLLMSQCSPVWKTGTIITPAPTLTDCRFRSQCSPEQLILQEDGDVVEIIMSQCSPVWKTGTILSQLAGLGPAELEVSM